MNELFYPKQISKFKTISCENQCFFAMPFSENYTNLYDTLTLYIENVGYKCIRVDNNLSASVPIINLILKGIATSQYVRNALIKLGNSNVLRQFDNKYFEILKRTNTICLFLCSSSMKTISRTNCGLGPIRVIVPPDVKVETTFFQRNFFITEPCTYPRKIAQKKEPPISQKSLFYAISLKFICCLLCCLLHIKFDQIMLYMAHSSQSVCLFLIPITCIPDHP